MIKAMKNLRIALFALLVVPLFANAAGGGGPIQTAGNDVADVASLQRGARNFVNYCSGCHSTQYIRFNKLQADLQLTEVQVTDNLMFAAQKPTN